MTAEEHETWSMDENLGGKLNKTGLGLIWHSPRGAGIKLRRCNTQRQTDKANLRIKCSLYFYCEMKVRDGGKDMQHVVLEMKAVRWRNLELWESN
jgi:hypothetical protein